MYKIKLILFIALLEVGCYSMHNSMQEEKFATNVEQEVKEDNTADNISLEEENTNLKTELLAREEALIMNSVLFSASILQKEIRIQELESKNRRADANYRRQYDALLSASNNPDNNLVNLDKKLQEGIAVDLREILASKSQAQVLDILYTGVTLISYDEDNSIKNKKVISVPLNFYLNDNVNAQVRENFRMMREQDPIDPSLKKTHVIKEFFYKGWRYGKLAFFYYNLNKKIPAYTLEAYDKIPLYYNGEFIKNIFPSYSKTIYSEDIQLLDIDKNSWHYGPSSYALGACALSAVGYLGYNFGLPLLKEWYAARQQ